jgi:carbamoylphosphate synthase small subunit
MCINDGTVAGMRMKYKFFCTVSPEASPGPHDSSYLFDQFIQNLKGYVRNLLLILGFLINKKAFFV